MAQMMRYTSFGPDVVVVAFNKLFHASKTQMLSIYIYHLEKEKNMNKRLTWSRDAFRRASSPAIMS